MLLFFFIFIFLFLILVSKLPFFFNDLKFKKTFFFFLIFIFSICFLKNLHPSNFEDFSHIIGTFDTSSVQRQSSVELNQEVPFSRQNFVINEEEFFKCIESESKKPSIITLREENMQKLKDHFNQYILDKMIQEVSYEFSKLIAEEIFKETSIQNQIEFSNLEFYDEERLKQILREMGISEEKIIEILEEIKLKKK